MVSHETISDSLSVAPGVLRTLSRWIPRSCSENRDIPEPSKKGKKISTDILGYRGISVCYDFPMTKQKAYSETEVHWSKSQQHILKLLAERKIFQTRFTNMEDRFAMEFVATIPDLDKPIAVSIVVPIRREGVNTHNEIRREKELNRLHRVLFYHLKAKFIAIDSGLTEFMEEFMPHLIILDKNGNSSTMGQTVLPQFKKNLDSGDQKPFNLLGPGN